MIRKDAFGNALGESLGRSSASGSASRDRGNLFADMGSEIGTYNGMTAQGALDSLEPINVDAGITNSDWDGYDFADSPEGKDWARTGGKSFGYGLSDPINPLKSDIKWNGTPNQGFKADLMTPAYPSGYLAPGTQYERGVTFDAQGNPIPAVKLNDGLVVEFPNGYGLAGMQNEAGASQVSLPEVENLYNPAQGYFQGAFARAQQGLNDPAMSLFEGLLPGWRHGRTAVCDVGDPCHRSV